MGSTEMFARLMRSKKTRTHAHELRQIGLGCRAWGPKWYLGACGRKLQLSEGELARASAECTLMPSIARVVTQTK